MVHLAVDKITCQYYFGKDELISYATHCDAMNFAM